MAIDPVELERLSKAATQGVWRATPLGGSSTVLCEERPKRNDTRIPAYAYRDEHCLAYPFIEEDLRARWDFVCFSHDDANLIVALVNAYRDGQLVPAQPSGDVVGVIGVLDPCGGTFADMVETAQEQMILEKAGSVRMPETCEDIVRRLSEDPCSCGVMYRAMTCLPCRCKAAITTYEAVSGVAKMREALEQISSGEAFREMRFAEDDDTEYHLRRERKARLIARAALGEQP